MCCWFLLQLQNLLPDLRQKFSEQFCGECIWKIWHPLWKYVGGSNTALPETCSSPLCFADAIRNEVYDERDILRLNSEDEYAMCFLHHAKGNLDKAVTLVDTSLKWRREIGLNGRLKGFSVSWSEHLTGLRCNFTYGKLRVVYLCNASCHRASHRWASQQTNRNLFTLTPDTSKQTVSPHGHGLVEFCGNSD